MNFISIHLVHKIEDLVKLKESALEHKGFFYFDKSIKDGKRELNRINIFAPYETEQVLPLSWYSISGSALFEIFKKLKNNDFYIYRRIDDKDYKVRLKKK